MERKGDVEVISAIFIWAFSLFLIVFLAPFISQTDHKVNINAIQQQSMKKYEAHTYTASMIQKEDFMENLSKYTIRQNSNSKSEIKTSVEKISGSSGEKPYRFVFKELGSNSELIEKSSDSVGKRRYSSFMVASPSRDLYKVSFGIGDD